MPKLLDKKSPIQGPRYLGPPFLLPLHKSRLCTSRHFAATQHFGRFRSEADIQRAAYRTGFYEYAACLPPRPVDEARSRLEVGAFNCVVASSQEAHRARFRNPPAW